MIFEFLVEEKDRETNARVGKIITKHGEVETPCFVAAATRAEVIGLDREDIIKAGVKSVITNTYHLHFRPGEDKIKEMGGVHKVLGFDGVVFSDSGGFQVLSLGIGKEHGVRKLGFFPGEQVEKQNVEGHNIEKFAIVKGDGVLFKSNYDEMESFIGARESMEIQSKLGADIIMAFDDCPSPFSEHDYVHRALKRTNRWALECLRFRDKRQALYGIIHGGYFRDLREKSARFISKLGFDGIAIGGPLGKSKKEMYEILDWIIPFLDSRPVHMLGIGYIEDIFECVERGIDSFDCVAPTREARHGTLYTGHKSGGNLENKFRLNIKNAGCRDDRKKIDLECECYTCSNYSRRDLWGMYRNMRYSEEDNKNYIRLASIHNVYFINNLMKEIRESIKDGRFLELKREWIGR